MHLKLTAGFGAGPVGLADGAATAEAAADGLSSPANRPAAAGAVREARPDGRARLDHQAIEEARVHVAFEVDQSKTADQQAVPLHNRWHPDNPSASSVKPGDEFRVECREWTDAQLGNNDSANDVRDVNLDFCHVLIWARASRHRPRLQGDLGLPWLGRRAAAARGISSGPGRIRTSARRIMSWLFAGLLGSNWLRYGQLCRVRSRWICRVGDTVRDMFRICRSGRPAGTIEL